MPNQQPELKDFLTIAKQSMAYYKEHKPELKAQMVKDRKKNFKGSFIPLIVGLGFLGVGFLVKGRMFIVYWYIWMIIAGIIALVALLNVVWNLWFIIRERNNT